jgi:hypothetical protein
MSFYKNLQEGIIIPRWAADLNATYGLGLFTVIYPLPYYISSLYHTLGFSFLSSVKLLLITTYIGSGFAMYAWLKNHLSEKSALTGSVFYLFAPYHLIDMHFRSNIGEMSAFLFLPLSLFLVDKSIQTKTTLWKFLSAISLSLLILSHPGISLLGFFLIFLYALFFIRKPKIQSLFSLVTPFILALLYSAFYWLPANIDSKYTHGHIEPNLKFLSIPQLLYSKWRWGLLFQGPHGELSFLLGYAHIIVIILAIYLIFIRKTKNYLLILLTLTSFCYIFLLLPQSKFIWNNIPVLKNMLLTYRSLAIVTLLTSAVAAFVTKEIYAKRLSNILLIIAIGTTILNWGNRKNLPNIKDEQIANKLPFIKLTGEGCWTTYPCQDKVPENHIESLNGYLEILYEKRTSTNHSYEVYKDRAGLVKENTYYFPGWKLFINGQENRIIHNNQQFPGVITFNLEKGKSRIELKFEDTKVRKYSLYLSLFSLLLSGIYLTFSRFIIKKIKDS